MPSTYWMLCERYCKARRAYQNALADRKRVRDRLAVRRSPVLQALAGWERRPVGAPTDFRSSRGPTPPPARPPAAVHRVYLGPILGWIHITSRSSPVGEPRDPTAELDLDDLYDRTSLELYWNAKREYLDARKAFFEYARTDPESSLQRAGELARQAAKSQLLGDEAGAESAWQRGQAEMEQALQRALAAYRASPEPRSDAAKKALVSTVALAQAWGVDDTAAARQAGAEVQRLVDLGNEAALREAANSVRMMCREVWDEYRGARHPVDAGLKARFVAAVAEAALALPEEDPLLQKMQAEVEHLLQFGDPDIGR